MNENKVIQEALAELKANGAFTAMNLKVISILEKALAPEPRFYKNQQVLVRDGGTEAWISAVFKGPSLNPAHKFMALKYSGGMGICSYLYCKPDPDAESIINWIEHDGSDGLLPKDLDKPVVWVDSSGCTQSSTSGALVLDTNVVRYAIIPLPEYLS